MDAKANKFTGAGSHYAEAPHGNEAGKMTIGNLVIQDSEVMLPPTPQPGGLMRPAMKNGSDSEKHIFKAPPTPRPSELGLDRLAMEKRKERLSSANGSPRENKRAKYDDSEDDSNDSDGQSPQFKGALFFSLYSLLAEPFHEFKFRHAPRQALMSDTGPKTLHPMARGSPLPRASVSKSIAKCGPPNSSGVLLRILETSASGLTRKATLCKISGIGLIGNRPFLTIDLRKEEVEMRTGDL